MKVSAGEVLIVALLNKVVKSAYQFGGFEVKGDVVKKSALNLDAKTTVIIPAISVKGDVSKFITDFEKTMNAWYYKIELI